VNTLSERPADVKNEEKRENAATEKDKQKVASETSMINRLHLTTGLQNFSFFFKEKPQLVTAGQGN